MLSALDFLSGANGFSELRTIAHAVMLAVMADTMMAAMMISMV